MVSSGACMKGVCRPSALLNRPALGHPEAYRKLFLGRTTAIHRLSMGMGTGLPVTYDYGYGYGCAGYSCGYDAPVVAFWI